MESSCDAVGSTERAMRVVSAPAQERVSPESLRGELLVTAHRQLVRDAVTIALGSMGFAPYDAPLPTTHAQVQSLRRCLAGRSTTSGVLIAEVSDAVQLREAAAVVSGIGIDWLVLAGVRPGPAWWALEDAGARLVLPLTSSLDQLVTALRDDAGRPPGACRPAPAAVRDGASVRRRQLLRQVGQLTNREMQILVALRGGSTVIEIASGFGVAESTVRTQVKSMLRKLGVRTQLQAVASLRQADEWLTGAG